jgi:hypothetical protein
MPQAPHADDCLIGDEGLELQQIVWPVDAALSQHAQAMAMSSADLWSSNLLEGLKAWIASSEDPQAGGSGDLSEAMSVIDGAFQAARSALTSLS